MKRTVLFFFLIVSAVNAFVTEPVVNAYEYAGYMSNIEGVGLWVIGDGRMTLQEGNYPELALYCDGKNKLCVYEKGQQCFVCKTVKKEYTDLDASDRKRILENIESAKKGKDSKHKEDYHILLIGFKDDRGELYTVSKKRLVKGKWTVSLPTKEDIKSSAKTASDNQKKIRLSISEKSANYKSESLIGYGDERIGKIAGSGISIENSERYTVKISARGIDIIIVPTLYIMDGDECFCHFISTVVLKKNNVYTCIGHIDGELVSVGADIDSDGVPELMTGDCTACEGCGTIRYFKIYPYIKELIVWSCS